MRRYLLISLSFSLLTACFSDSNSPATVQEMTQQNASETMQETSVNTVTKPILMARIGSDEVSQDDIDKRLELKLFDLEWVKYELRREMLGTIVDEKLKQGQLPASAIEILIEPPIPPRLALQISDQQPMHGNKQAPITLAIFCSYPSVHCANMTKTYDDLLEAYPGQLKLIFFDFPQAFHFNAGHAARAARCANQQGQFWPYHKGLLANFDQISDALFKRLARQVNIDVTTFEHCIKSNEFTDAVKANLKQAEALGLSKVPVTLVNGLFLNGPKSFDILRFYIDRELARLNIVPAPDLQQAQQKLNPEDIPISQLPLRLEAISLGSRPADSSATIQHTVDETSQTYQYDDEILANTFLVLINENSVVLEHNGNLERIILSGGQYSASADDTSLNPANQAEQGSLQAGAEHSKQRPRGKSLADPDEIPAGLEYTFRGVVSPKGETPLSRSWLTEQLAERERLKSHFEPAEHEVEGVKVMRLTNINENDFYQTLGLQEQDVILRVNNEWVHSQQNGLFETLENQQEVSVVLMRKGLPVHLNYHIN